MELKNNILNRIAYRFFLVAILAVTMFSSGNIMFFSPVPSRPFTSSSFAFATFPGENGKIAVSSHRDGNAEIYVMNAGGSGQTNISNNPADEDWADWGTNITPPPPPSDTTPPVIALPDDITAEAAAPSGAEVLFEVSAKDEVDGPVDVECDHNSGDTFPIGDTVVTCSEDLAGNAAEESFTITVQDTTAPDVEITKAVDKKGVEIAEGSTTKSHYIQITFQVTDAVGVDKIECRLDRQQAFTPCTSPVVNDGLKKGTHTFTVRSTDAADNTGEDHLTWIVNPPAALGAPGRQ
jgi:hypothetical protein